MVVVVPGPRLQEVQAGAPLHQELEGALVLATPAVEVGVPLLNLTAVAGGVGQLALEVECGRRR